METFMKLVGAFGVVVMFLAFAALLLGLPLMWLWNWLMPELFGLKEINFWQAIGLNLIGSILFKSTSSSSSK
jgi:hypothetical protein